MERKSTRWGQAAPAPHPDAEKPAAQSAIPPAGSGQVTDAMARDVLNRLGASDLRSSFAQAVFPYDPSFGSRGQWAREVGCMMSNIIHSNPSLWYAMRCLGYVKGKPRYSVPQRIVLVKYLLGAGILKAGR